MKRYAVGPEYEMFLGALVTENQIRTTLREITDGLEEVARQSEEFRAFRERMFGHSSPLVIKPTSN